MIRANEVEKLLQEIEANPVTYRKELERFHKDFKGTAGEDDDGEDDFGDGDDDHADDDDDRGDVDDGDDRRDRRRKNKGRRKKKGKSSQRRKLKMVSFPELLHFFGFVFEQFGPEATVADAFAKLRMRCTASEVAQAGETALRLVNGVLDHPNDDRFRTADMHATACAPLRSVFSKGGQDLLRALGFRRSKGSAGVGKKKARKQKGKNTSQSAGAKGEVELTVAVYSLPRTIKAAALEARRTELESEFSQAEGVEESLSAAVRGLTEAVPGDKGGKSGKGGKSVKKKRAGKGKGKGLDGGVISTDGDGLPLGQVITAVHCAFSMGTFLFVGEERLRSENLVVWS